MDKERSMSPDEQENEWRLSSSVASSLATELLHVVANESAVVTGYKEGLSDGMELDLTKLDRPVVSLISSYHDAVKCLLMGTYDINSNFPFSRGPMKNRVFLETEVEARVDSLIDDVRSIISEFLEVEDDGSQNDEATDFTGPKISDLKNVLGSFSCGLEGWLSTNQKCRYIDVEFGGLFYNRSFSDFKLEPYCNKIYNFITSREILEQGILWDANLQRFLLDGIRRSFEFRRDGVATATYLSRLIIWINTNKEFLSKKYGGKEADIREALHYF